MINIISLILDIFINKYINQESLFLPLLTLVSIIFIKNNNYYIKIVLLGFIYDLFFTNFYILNILLFFIIGFINKHLFKLFNKNCLDYILIAIFDIIIYNLLLFLIYNIFNYKIYSFSELLFILKHFFILNIIYVIVINYIKKENK